MTTAVLRVRDDVIVMQTMLWPDEVRKPDFAGLDATEHAAKPQELKMAKLLVETLAGDYDASEYDDDYQKAVEALVQAKLEGGEVKAPEQPKKSTGEVVDLLAALQRSVDAAKTSRGESTSSSTSTSDADSGSGSADKKAAKKTAAKKPPAKKTAAKKTAKKAAAKKATKKADAKKAS
jgi:DNA end-binding protein Ku